MLDSQSLQISLELLAEHKSDESLWLAVHGLVYDLSTFGPDHPGGIDVLREGAGTDATEMYEYAGHSADAMQKLDRYRIGVLFGALAPNSASDRHQKAQLLPRVSSQTGSSAAVAAAFDLGDRVRWIIVLATGAIVATAMVNGIMRYALSSLLQYTSFLGGLSSFWAGLGLALLIGGVGIAYGYSVFAKTLDYDNEVFSYPATIPRPRNI